MRRRSTCSDSLSSRLRNDALAAADISTVSFVAAGAFLLGGLVLYLTAR